MPKYNVISIGSATIDAILKSNDFKIVKTNKFESGTAICQMYGSKVEVNDFHISSGGGATNSSSLLSFLGFKTSCVSIIGGDSFSDLIVDELNDFGVDIDNLKVEPTKKSAFSVVLTSKDGGRTVLSHRSTCSNIDLQVVKGASLNTQNVYLTSLGGNYKNALQVIKYLNKKSISVFWNPGASEIFDFKIKDMPQIDVLSLNVEEASMVSKVKMSNIKEVVQFFIKNSPAKVTLITLGEKGAFVLNKDQRYFGQGVKVDVENTLGAGDAFGSCFYYFYLKEKNLKEALQKALVQSASVVTKTGAKMGYTKNFSKFKLPIVKSF